MNVANRRLITRVTFIALICLAGFVIAAIYATRNTQTQLQNDRNYIACGGWEHDTSPSAPPTIPAGPNGVPLTGLLPATPPHPKC